MPAPSAQLPRVSSWLPAATSSAIAATNAATVVFNFLVVGVTAKVLPLRFHSFPPHPRALSPSFLPFPVTKGVAVGAWPQAGARIRLALGMAPVMGMVAVALLLALLPPSHPFPSTHSPSRSRLSVSHFTHPSPPFSVVPPLSPLLPPPPDLRSKVVAVGAWAQVGARIRLALGMALVMGMVAVALLLALLPPFPPSPSPIPLYTPAHTLSCPSPSFSPSSPSPPYPPQVTKVVAVGAWAQVGARIRLALGMALVMGIVAVGLLLALQQPLWLLLADTPKVLPFARSYFYLRVIGVPPQLLVMCTSGILQGYKVRSMRFSAVMLDAAIGGYSQGAALRAQLLLSQGHWRASPAACHVHLGNPAGLQGTAPRVLFVDPSVRLLGLYLHRRALPVVEPS
ncbi:unnamed protein product [Closterium sp. NIES-53]